MSPKELKALLKMLKLNGVTHFKSADFEISLRDSSVIERGSPRSEVIGLIPVPATKEVSRETSEALPLEEKPIPHEVVQLTSLLKLSDVDLVDRLFPDHSREEAEESANDTN